MILKWDGKAVDHRSLPWLVARTPVGKPVPVLDLAQPRRGSITVVTEKMPQ